MKPIRLSSHALGYGERRNFTIAEVEAAIRESNWKDAEIAGRLCARLNFPFNSELVWKVLFNKTSETDFRRN